MSVIWAMSVGGESTQTLSQVCQFEERFPKKANLLIFYSHGESDTGVKSFSGLNNEDERRSSLPTIVPVSLHYHKRRTAAPRVGHRSNNERVNLDLT